MNFQLGLVFDRKTESNWNFFYIFKAGLKTKNRFKPFDFLKRKAGGVYSQI